MIAQYSKLCFLISVFLLCGIASDMAIAEMEDQTNRGLKLVGATPANPSLSRVALVVGNASYQNSPLKNPLNDANDIAQTLKGLGFDVTLLLDASLRDTVTQIQSFAQRLTDSNSVGLFYYAGHGMQIEGRNYLIPVDAAITDESQVLFDALDVGRVLQAMENAGNMMNIVILDACRDNPFSRSFRSGHKGLAQMDAPSGTLIAYATAPGSVSADSGSQSGRNGLYTKHLLRQMTSNMPIEIVFKKVRQNVMNETRQKQVPWESSSLIGNFCFSGNCNNSDEQPTLFSNQNNFTNTASVVPANRPFKHIKDNAKPWYKRWYTWAAAIVATALIISCSGGGDGGSAGQGGTGGGCSF